MTLDRRQLNAFLAVCEYRTLGMASQKLNLTQPALSRTIRLLETEVGVPLFERHPLGMEMTAYARALRPYAERLVSEGRRAFEEIRAMRNLRKGYVRIGAVTSVASSVVPLALQRLLRRLPGLEADIVEDLGDRLRVELSKGTIDVVIAGEIGVQDSDEFITRTPLTKDTWSIFARTGHPCFADRKLELGELLAYPWVTLPLGHPMHEPLRDIFRASGIEPPKPTISTRSISAMRSLVATGDFISCMPKTMVAWELRHASIRSALAPEQMWKRQLFLYLRRNGQVSLATKALIGDLQSAVEQEDL